MRLDIQSAVALRSKGRRAFGTARWIEGQRLGLTTYGDVTVGDRLEMRLELTGAYDSVWAEVMIETARPAGIGGPQLCTGDIVFIPDEDQDKLEQWVEERSVSQLSARGETASVGTVTDTPASGSVTGAARGRGAVSSALRKGLARTPAPVAATRAALSLSRDGATLSGTWQTWQDLAADWTRQLSKSLLRVDDAGPCPPRGCALTVRLCLPDGQILAVQGIVTDTDPGGMMVALDLPGASRRKLSRASQQL